MYPSNHEGQYQSNNRLDRVTYGDGAVGADSVYGVGHNSVGSNGVRDGVGHGGIGHNSGVGSGVGHNSGVAPNSVGHNSTGNTNHYYHGRGLQLRRPPQQQQGPAAYLPPTAPHSHRQYRAYQQAPSQQQPQQVSQEYMYGQRGSGGHNYHTPYEHTNEHETNYFGDYRGNNSNNNSHNYNNNLNYGSSNGGYHNGNDTYQYNNDYNGYEYNNYYGYNNYNNNNNNNYYYEMKSNEYYDYQEYGYEDGYENNQEYGMDGYMSGGMHTDTNGVIDGQYVNNENITEYNEAEYTQGTSNPPDDINNIKIEPSEENVNDVNGNSNGNKTDATEPIDLTEED